jgi:hypothetical protein
LLITRGYCCCSSGDDWSIDIQFNFYQLCSFRKEDLLYTYFLKGCGDIFVFKFVFKWFNSFFSIRLLKQFLHMVNNYNWELNQHHSFWQLLFIWYYFPIDSHRIKFTFSYSSIKFVGSEILFIDFTQWVQS